MGGVVAVVVFGDALAARAEVSGFESAGVGVGVGAALG